MAFPNQGQTMTAIKPGALKNPIRSEMLKAMSGAGAKPGPKPGMPKGC